MLHSRNLAGGGYHRETYDSLARSLAERGGVFIAKPSVGTCSGAGVRLMNSESSTPEILSKELKKLGSNWVAQGLVSQHPLLAKLNASSCNIVRVNTLRVGGGIEVLNSTVRFGIPGSLTDVSHDGNRELFFVIGVSPEGVLSEIVYDNYGNRSASEDHGIASGSVLPGYRDMVALACDAHKELHRFDLVGFDIAIDGSSTPILIEYNLTAPGISYYQYVHGPFFGDYFEDVLSRCV